jgi:hypothetical protein
MSSKTRKRRRYQEQAAASSQSRFYCLDADDVLARATGAEWWDEPEVLLDSALTTRDRVLVNMAAPDELRWASDDSPWRSRWTVLIAETLLRTDAVIIVSHRVAPREAARRLLDALAAPGLSPVTGDVTDVGINGSGAADLLLASWEAAGLLFVEEPLSVTGSASITEALGRAARGPESELRRRRREIRLRLRLIDAFGLLRTTWHRARNQAAALRILGGAVLSWLEDTTNPRAGQGKQQRGIPPLFAADVLRGWVASLSAAPAAPADARGDLVDETVLERLIEILVELGESRWDVSNAAVAAGKLTLHRSAILIDDEADSAGWRWILRAILEHRFGVSLTDNDVETDDWRAADRIDAGWLEGKDIAFLDLRFPSDRRAGIRLLDQVTKVVSYSLPVILFSAEATGSAVRRAVARGASYFFKEYEDDRSAVDYYRALEHLVNQALARTPQLIVSRSWAMAREAISPSSQFIAAEAQEWIEQGIGLLGPSSGLQEQVHEFDLALMRAGVALESVVRLHLETVVPAADKVKGIRTQIVWQDAIPIFVRPDAIHLSQGAQQFWKADRKSYKPADRFREGCGFFVKQLRDCVAHARIAPDQVTELEAVTCYLALMQCIAPGALDTREARVPFAALRDYLRRNYPEVSNPPYAEDRLLETQAALGVCQSVLNRWYHGNPDGRQLVHIVKDQIRQGKVQPLTPLLHAAVLAALMELYATYRTESTSLIGELCWRRIALLDRTLIPCQ